MKSNKIITAAGILLIMGGLLNGFYWLVLMNSGDGGGFSFSGLVICVLFLLIVIGGICTLRKKFWGLALAGAICCSIFGTIALFVMPFFGPIIDSTFIRFIVEQICSMLITLTGLIAIILLALNKGAFQSRKEKF